MSLVSVIRPDIDIPPGQVVPGQFIRQWLKILLDPALLERSQPVHREDPAYFSFGPLPAFENDTTAEPGDPFSLAGWGNARGDTVYRLREGIERFLISDINNPAASAAAQSDVFVMYDWLSVNVQDFNHAPGGCNVLFMDGHVEFIRYPSTQAPVIKPLAIAMPILTQPQ